MTTTNTPETNVSKTQLNIVKVYSITQRKLNDMGINTKIKTKDLVNAVVAETGCPASLVRSLVSAVVGETEGVHVLRGKHGGIYKGEVEIKVDERPRCETCHQVIRVKGKKKIHASILVAASSTDSIEESDNDSDEDESEEDSEEESEDTHS